MEKGFEIPIVITSTEAMPQQPQLLPPVAESGSDRSDGEPIVLTLVKTWEVWELDICPCPEVGPFRRRPMDKIIPGESQLRCFECLCPYYRAAKMGTESIQ